MSIFNKDLIESEIPPQKYFEMLCERKFGFNFTEKSQFNVEYSQFILNDIICEVRRAYPNKYLYCISIGEGHLEMVEVIFNMRKPMTK